MNSALGMISGHFRSMATFDRLGGADSFFGRQHVFNELMYEAHEAAGQTDDGMYCFKKIGWYGNIVSFLPTCKAVQKFLELGYTREHVDEMRKWHDGGACRGAIDEVMLGSYLKSILGFKGLDKAIEDMDKAPEKTDEEG